MFARAGQPELIRSNQKDLYYLAYLRESVGQTFRNVRGAHSWIKWKHELDLIGDIIYFGLTTIPGFQTLGEEYCNIVQVDPTKTAIPTTPVRSCLVFLHTVVPYLLNKLLSRLQAVACSHEHWPQNLSEGLRLWLCSEIPKFQQLIIFVHRAHLAMFYMNGVFYHIAKRLAGITYLLVRTSLKDSSSRPTYRLLGYLSAIQVILTLLFHVSQKLKPPNQQLFNATSPSVHQSDDKGRQTTPSAPRKNKCSLCLEALTDITSTPCGHLFCWQCITGWCNGKPQCPLCREPVKLSRLVYLHCYQPA